MSLNDLISFFSEHEFKEPIRINKCTVVSKKTVESHISFLLANSGNKCYLPYYNRLQLIYKIIQENEKFI